MFFVRFVALIALAIWIGAMATPWLGVFSLSLACGVVILVALFVQKFVGPPPRAFTIRAGTVILMLIVAIYSAATGVARNVLLAVNGVLALFLLSWYAHE